MKEYIERKEAYKRLENNKKWADDPSTMDYASQLILTVPTADVVEVVRCGECIHSKKRNKEEDTVMCLKYMAYKGVKGFCNEGEKKKDGE